MQSYENARIYSGKKADVMETCGGLYLLIPHDDELAAVECQSYNHAVRVADDGKFHPPHPIHGPRA